MSGMIADHIRSASGKIWFDRFDIGGFARFARKKYPIKTAIYIAAETGLPVDSIKKWLAGEAVPGGKAMLALLCAYGPDLAAEMLNGAPPWMSSARRAVRAQRLEQEIATRRAELALIDEGRSE